MGAPKRNPAPLVASGGGAKTVLAKQQLKTRNKRSHHKTQPRAIARNFGIAHAVFIRDKNVETRAGLFDSLQAAQAAADDLNRIFAGST